MTPQLLLPWERLLWSSRPWRLSRRLSGERYLLTDFRLLHISRVATSELALDDVGEICRAESRADRLLGTSTIVVHPATGGPLRPEDIPMKLIVAIIRPDRLNEVLEALYRAEVTGLTVSRVLGHGGETDRVETYRGTTVKMDLQEKVRLEIGVSEPFVDITVRAILASARTGEVGDGKVFVLDVAQVHRIRTGERDERAVTPTAMVEA